MKNSMQEEKENLQKAVAFLFDKGYDKGSNSKEKAFIEGGYLCQRIF